MNKKKEVQIIQGSLFEEDYLVRTLGALTNYPEVALTELVANAWDAGATEVKIAIPTVRGKKIIIEDNGVGLSKEDFHYRWMRLGYNRIKHQGKNVLFPPGKIGNRQAYGRNGVGRHGLLCFNKEYTVKTYSNGESSKFIITTLSESEPFVIKYESFGTSKKHGTRLEVKVIKNLPNENRILNVISAKFLHDPNFKVYINDNYVPLEQLSGLINKKELKVGNITLEAHFIDSQKASRSTIYQGIAFWQGGRLVGEPSWILGNEMIIDGRTNYAKRYTVVVKTDDLNDFICEDWTGFKKDETMKEVYKVVGEYVTDMFGQIAKENIEDTKQQIKNDFANQYTNLSPFAKYEVNEVIESITYNHPTAKQEVISLAVEALINLEKTRTGKELLLKLSKLTEDDVSGLNEILDKWTVRDALMVLDEIDYRISIIEAIKKLSCEKGIDELHVLHPLITGARWLFGPEFESAEYSSNNQLQTVVKKLFDKEIQKDVFTNYRKRPDLVALSKSTLSITGTEIFDNDTGLAIVNKILIIELKRGGFKLTREERNQAQGYVEDFTNCRDLIGSPYVEAFVVGESFSDKVQPITTVKSDNNVELGKVRICTFSQLVDTAEKRLFGLRQKLNDRYDKIPGMELFMKHSEQLKVDFSESSLKKEVVSTDDTTS
jgi:hypothetical protein